MGELIKVFERDGQTKNMPKIFRQKIERDIENTLWKSIMEIKTPKGTFQMRIKLPYSVYQNLSQGPQVATVRLLKMDEIPSTKPNPVQATTRRVFKTPYQKRAQKLQGKWNWDKLITIAENKLGKACSNCEICDWV